LELNGKEYDTFIKEIQYDPLTDQVLHVDLYHPPAERPVTMEVPIRFYGEAKGRKSGGIVDPLRETVEVRGPAAKIPELIELDITELDIGQALHAEDVSLPDGVELLTPPEAILVTILAPRKVVEEVPEEVAAEAAEEAAPAAEAEAEEKKEKEAE
jgi:large subunit ribosomal protein L25